MSVSNLLFGPLTSVETRRLTARPWMFWARLGSGLLGVAICLTVAFIVWVSAEAQIEDSPGPLIRGALLATALCALLVALLVSPALLAGTLAGEKDQGTLGMLLIARVASWEIVAGRLFPRLAQVAFLTIGALMPLAYLAGLNSLGLGNLLLLVGLIGSVAFGAGALAVCISALVRRARDALMIVFGVYVIALITLTTGPRIAPGAVWTYLDAVDPFRALAGLCLNSEARPAVVASLLWLGLGALAVTVGAWRLRPAYLRHLAGSSRRRATRQAARMRAVGDRPMLWKELFVERTAALGRLGQWITWLLITLLVAGSLGSAAVIVAVERFGWGPITVAEQARWVLRVIVGNTAMPLSWLVQWAIGLRAAVSIASERQRETWDSLLTSPLDGAAIIVGKFGGSLYALRGLLGATLLSWVVALACGELAIGQFLTVLVSLLIGSALIAAVGVQISLMNTGAARSMAFTLGIWLVAAFGSMVAAGLAAFFLCLFGLLGMTMLGHLLAGLGLIDSPDAVNIPSLTFGTAFSASYELIRASLYISATVMLVGWLGRSFDRLAGRGWRREAADKPVWVTAEGQILSGPPPEVTLGAQSLAEEPVG